MENELHKYLVSGAPADLPSRGYLENIALRYPWFRLPAWLLLHHDGLSAKEVLAEVVSDDPIEVFLRKDSHKIVADDSTPERIEMAEVEENGYESEFVTEELAEIYLSQGLREQAVNIYDKLCLVYPEKSVYFAELISKIEQS